MLTDPLIIVDTGFIYISNVLDDEIVKLLMFDDVA